MNDVLNMRRFSQYAPRQWSMYARRFAIFAGGTLLVMLLQLGVKIWRKGDSFGELDIHSLISSWFTVMMGPYTVLAVMETMRPMKDRLAAAMENSVPVSGTEKWLFVLLNTTVVSTAVYFLAMIVAAATGVAMAGVGTVGDYFRLGAGNYGNLPFVILSVQSIAMYAGTLEKRNHAMSILGVVAAVVATMFVFGLGPELLSKKLEMGMEYGTMFSFGNAETASELSRVRYYGGMANWDQTFWSHVALGAMAVLFWTCAWFNFRERSIK